MKNVAMKNIPNWVKKSKFENPLRTAKSDQNTLDILESTNAYLHENEEIVGKINEILRVHRTGLDLLPETLENVGSGHVFPIGESEYELESSIHLCKLGFYKHAIIALRNVLELGLLSVYWDIDGKSHINIPEWLSSNEQTPFRKEIIKVLKKNERIVEFDKEHNIFVQITDLYHELSDFSHTKGKSFSSTELSRANFNTFNPESIRKWLDFMGRVAAIVITIHILQYPVGLQNVNLFSKFGFNSPQLGFLEPHQVDGIRQFLDGKVTETLQTISDADPRAKFISQKINDMPDLPDEDIRAQEEEQEKLFIQTYELGYRGWIRERKKGAKIEKKSYPIEYKIRIQRWKRLKKWAKENGCYKKSSSSFHS